MWHALSKRNSLTQGRGHGLAANQSVFYTKSIQSPSMCRGHLNAKLNGHSALARVQGRGAVPPHWADGKETLQGRQKSVSTGLLMDSRSRLQLGNFWKLSCCIYRAHTFSKTSYWTWCCCVADTTAFFARPIRSRSNKSTFYFDKRLPHRNTFQMQLISAPCKAAVLSGWPLYCKFCWAAQQAPCLDWHTTSLLCVYFMYW
jgi:hypothetical protein